MGTDGINDFLSWMGRRTTGGVGGPLGPWAMIPAVSETYNSIFIYPFFGRGTPESDLHYDVFTATAVAGAGLIVATGGTGGLAIAGGGVTAGTTAGCGWFVAGGVLGIGGALGNYALNEGQSDGADPPPEQPAPTRPAHKYAGKTVSDILRLKRGSIRQAPLPEGAKPWSEIESMTWEQVQASKGPGWKAVRKLLTDQRFDR